MLRRKIKMRSDRRLRRGNRGNGGNQHRSQHTGDRDTMKTTIASSFTLKRLAGAIAAGLLLAPPAFAQDTSDAEENALLEEVIVTASRREEALQDVAIAMSVLETDDFIDAGYTGLDGILPFVPGVSISSNGRPYFSNVYMRGINADISAGVASYVDEIPFGSSTVYTNPTPLDGTLLDLGTLDVMKGPQGTLYGASAMGGILRYNTREASLDNWTGSASANLSDTNGGGFNPVTLE